MPKEHPVLYAGELQTTRALHLKQIYEASRNWNWADQNIWLSYFSEIFLFYIPVCPEYFNNLKFVLAMSFCMCIVEITTYLGLNRRH
jgi:hypothetical protein